MGKVIGFIKEHWKDSGKWLLGAVLGLFLAKMCDVVWPEAPIVVKEVADTVKVIHSLAPLPETADSLLTKKLQQQLLNLELLDKYDTYITRRQDIQSQVPCKLIMFNPYPNSKGYSQKSASSHCFIELSSNQPFLDVSFSFLRDDYIGMINTLGIKLVKADAAGRRTLLLDQNYSPKKSGQQLIRIVDDFPPGDYTIEAGFILKDDKDVKYPCYYSKSFSFRR